MTEIDLIDELYAKPVDLGGSKEGPEFEDENGKTVRPVTCNDYFRLLEEGSYPPTTYDMTMTSYFVNRCDTLRFFQDAIPSRQSLVRTFALTKDSMTQLPASIVPSWGTEDDEQQLHSRKSWAAAFPQARLKLKDDGSIEITDVSFITHISLLGWADFDHDGTEDVLLFLAVYANGGSFRTYYHEILTRTTNNGPLLEIDTKEMNDKNR